MPRLRITTSVADTDFAYREGEEVDMTPEQAQQVLVAGWGELVRGHAPATPEDRARLVETPEGRTGDIAGHARQRTRRGA